MNYRQAIIYPSPVVRDENQTNRKAVICQRGGVSDEPSSQNGEVTIVIDIDFLVAVADRAKISFSTLIKRVIGLSINNGFYSPMYGVEHIYRWCPEIVRVGIYPKHYR